MKKWYRRVNNGVWRGREKNEKGEKKGKGKSEKGIIGESYDNFVGRVMKRKRKGLIIEKIENYEGMM